MKRRQVVAGVFFAAIAAMSLVFAIGAGAVYGEPVAYKTFDGEWKIIDSQDWPQLPKDLPKGAKATLKANIKTGIVLPLRLLAPAPPGPSNLGPSNLGFFHLPQ